MIKSNGKSMSVSFNELITTAPVTMTGYFGAIKTIEMSDKLFFTFHKMIENEETKIVDNVPHKSYVRTYEILEE